MTETILSEDVLREDMSERVERIDRRIDDGFRAIAEQFVEQHACMEFGYVRLDQALQAVSSGIARLERKLDRILALSVEARGRRC